METPDQPTLLSPWDLLAVAGFAGLAVFYAWILPTLPDPVPTHFDTMGVANGWTPKASLPWVIFGIPGFIWAFTTALGVILGLTQNDPVKARALAMAPMRGLLGLGLAVIMGFSLLAPAFGSSIILLGVGVFLALLVAGIFLMVRDYTRVKAVDADMSFYKWGIFYVNPDDERIWVPKPIGVGSTLNFARPAGWAMLVLLLLPAVVIILLTRR